MDFQSQETIALLNAQSEYIDMNEEDAENEEIHIHEEETEIGESVQSETQETQPVQVRRKRRLTSHVWNEFTSVGIGEDGKQRGACNHCGLKLVINTKTHGTTTLSRHLEKCPKKPKEKDKVTYDHRHKSTGAVGASASKSSCVNGVSNIHSKKRQRSLISEGTTRSAMLLGLDILDCPVCFEALTIPIFQCENGHLVCSSCCPKLSNKCPACAFPIGHNRCRAMECVLESVFVPCQNANLGCTKNVSYGKESTHEKECVFSQCSCPALDCNYTGSYDNIYSHFVSDHRHNSKSISFLCGGSVDVQMNIVSDKILVIWEFKKRLLFALQCFNEPHGVYVTVRCIAPSSQEVEKFAYCLYYSMDGHDLTYKSQEVKRVLEVTTQSPQDNFMFVPQCLLTGDLLEIKLCIGLNVPVDS